MNNNWPINWPVKLFCTLHIRVPLPHQHHPPKGLSSFMTTFWLGEKPVNRRVTYSPRKRQGINNMRSIQANGKKWLKVSGKNEEENILRVGLLVSLIKQHSCSSHSICEFLFSNNHIHPRFCLLLRQHCN